MITRQIYKKTPSFSQRGREKNTHSKAEKIKRNDETN